MSNQDDFFTPEEVDKQIDHVSRLNEGERTDAEAMTYLRSFYGTDAQQEREMLDRVWNRIVDAAPPFTVPLQLNVQQKHEREEVRAMQNQPTLFSNRATDKRHTTLLHRLGMLAAALVLVALVGSMTILFSSMRHNAGGPGSGNPKPPTIITTVPPSPTPTANLVPFKVTSTDMSVMPGSIAGISCGAHLTVTYKAIIHVAANSPGGTVQFGYTVNNGRSQNTASVTFYPGETIKTYTFTWSGALPADHTYPGPGGINVTSPNQLISPLVGPSGTCVSQAAFAVTRIDMAVSPTSVQGLTCGSSIVVTYTATIHVAANSPGGVVQFGYTVNNGRSQNIASLTFYPGETIKTYTFTWSGALPADHTYPGPGGINVNSPHQLISPLVGPSGMCK
ncbi:MAG: hypothetical protein ABI234_15225 [Ktedonobacteraceae bacterium]